MIVRCPMYKLADIARVSKYTSVKLYVLWSGYTETVDKVLKMLRRAGEI
jgi:hypothetical protein